MTEGNIGRLPWTEEEDNALRNAVEIHGECDRWKTVSTYVPGRTNKACRKRWLHSLDPRLKKTAWTPAEDHLLTTLYSQHGSKWSTIARQIPGRTDDACSKRYREALDPSLKKEEWTPEEDTQLAQIYAQLGSSWGQVGQALNRSGLACRNRWRLLQRKNPQSKVKQVDNRGSDDHHFTTETPPMYAVFGSLLTPDTFRHAREDASSIASTSNTPSSTPSPNAPVAILPSISEVTMTLGATAASFPNSRVSGGPIIAGEVDWRNIPFVLPFNGSDFGPPLTDAGMFCSPGGQLPFDLRDSFPCWPVYDDFADLALDSPASQLISPIPNAQFPPTVDDLIAQEDGSNISPVDSFLQTPPFMSASIPSSPVASPALRPPPDLSPPAEAYLPEKGNTSPVAYHTPMDPAEPVPCRIKQADLRGTQEHTEPDPHVPCSLEQSDCSRTSPRPSKRRKANVEVNWLSSDRAVTTDSLILAYACGHPVCWPPGESTGKRCFATSRELSEHFKGHQTRDSSLRPFKCALADCNKSWKSINGLQYHLQVSPAHFQQAVQTTLSSSSDPLPELDETPSEERHYRCDVEGCRKVYRQLSGLKYHRTKGHPPTIPTQLQVVPPSLARRLADPTTKKKKPKESAATAVPPETRPP